MTYEEALKYFKNNEEGKNGATKYLRCKKKAIEALEKQIPVKPKRDVTEVAPCPVCGFSVIEKVENFCPHCGQALDWSDQK